MQAQIFIDRKHICINIINRYDIKTINAYTYEYNILLKSSRQQPNQALTHNIIPNFTTNEDHLNLLNGRQIFISK